MAGPAEVELVRHKVYNFRSLIAERWRDRRLLIAGDAAHVMPPFMGQGMCSGMRDAWNLAWKLGMILDKKIGDGLLDTYQAERGPHVSQITDLSIYLGKIICIPDAAAAAERDREFLGGTAPPPPFPQLTDGLLRRDASGEPAPGAGLLAPHVRLEYAGQQLRLDALTGGGFVLITRSVSLDRASARDLAALGAQHVTLGSAASEARDLDGRLDAFLTEHGWSAMLVRPDYYVYGGAADAAAAQRLIAALITELGKYGFAQPLHEERQPVMPA